MSSWRSQPRASGNRGATSNASQWNSVNGISIRNGGPDCRSRYDRSGWKYASVTSPVVVGGSQVPDRRLPLEVQQRQRDRDQRREATAGPRLGPPEQRDDRAGDERREPLALLPTGLATA